MSRGARVGDQREEAAGSVLAELAASVPFGLAVLDAGLRFRFVNAWLAQLDGLPVEAYRGRRVGDMIGADKAGDVEALLSRALTGSTPVVTDLLVSGAVDGADRLHHLTAVRATLEDGAPALVLLVEDRTEQALVEQALEESEQRFRSLADAAPVMIWLSGPGFAMEFVNDEVCRFTGRAAGALLGTGWHEIVHPDDLPDLLDTASRAVAAGARFEVTYRMQAADGSWRWVDVRARPRLPVPDHSYVGVVIDVDAQRRSQEELVAQATSDDLTGLANRAAFLREVTTALRRLEREAGPVALLYLDLDGFKRVNDVLGHSEGDQVLRDVGRRLASAVRPMDHVGRLGGDEFGVLLGGSSRPGDAMRVAQRIQQALALPASPGQPGVSASVGLAFASDPGDSADALVRRADTAMFEAKARGGPVVVYDDDLGREVRLRQETADLLRAALREGSLHVAYQPAVRVGSGEVVGFEALVRWRHPVRGVLEAGGFMEVVADTGLAVELDTWVAQGVIGQLTDWRERLGAGAPRWMAVNCSPAALMAPGFAPALLDQLHRARLAPCDLVVQVSEPLVGDLAGGLLEPLRTLNRAGVLVAHDDVGEGPTSLTHLFTAPADIVMLGPSVLAGAVHDPADALSRSLADVARRRGSLLLAEGVETSRHLAAAAALGCQLAQGLAVAPPMEPESAEEWLRQRRS